MTLTQLRYALVLKKHQNFKKAAEQLEISQPALSVQIQKLEDEIGIKLFNRSGSPIQVTRDGDLFLIKAQEVVNNAKQLTTFAQELNDDYSGSLEIGVIATLAPFLVPLFSHAIQKDYPNLQLVFKEQTTEVIVNGVRSGDLDVGIISTPIDVYGIQSIPLFYERFYMYSSESGEGSNEIKLEDINYDRLWLLNEGNCFRDQVNDFCDIKSIRKGKKFIYQSNSIDALIRIEDFNEFFDTQYLDEDFDTLGGMIISKLGKFPKRGESLEINPLTFKILRSNSRRLQLIEVRDIE